MNLSRISIAIMSVSLIINERLMEHVNITQKTMAILYAIVYCFWQFMPFFDDIGYWRQLFAQSHYSYTYYKKLVLLKNHIKNQFYLCVNQDVVIIILQRNRASLEWGSNHTWQNSRYKTQSWSWLKFKCGHQKKKKSSSVRLS